MPRTSRVQSESGWYHVIVKGAGRRTIFETDDDRRTFLKMLADMRDTDNIEIAAWTLMDNHVHLVVRTKTNNLQIGMQRLCTSYAVYFNKVNEHVGPVFQGRYKSFPIEADSYLLQVIRYVHLNCIDKGIVDPAKYEWCSYGTYLGNHLSEINQWVIDVFGGLNPFVSFHREGVDVETERLCMQKSRLNDEEARWIASRAFGKRFAETIPLLGKQEKSEAIYRLHQMGLSARQIERLTGVGRRVIRKACGLKNS